MNDQCLAYLNKLSLDQVTRRQLALFSVTLFLYSLYSGRFLVTLYQCNVLLHCEHPHMNDEVSLHQFKRSSDMTFNYILQVRIQKSVFHSNNHQKQYISCESIQQMLDNIQQLLLPRVFW